MWGHLLTFLGGPHACIGYRFSLVEYVQFIQPFLSVMCVLTARFLIRMKALVFTLIRTFEFELAVPPEEIMKKSLIVTRPLVKSEREKGTEGTRGEGARDALWYRLGVEARSRGQAEADLVSYPSTRER